MSVSSLFIRRPVMTTLVMLGILLFGVMAFRLLPVSDLPNVDFPTINVSAGLPGASPETMASAVATPLEKQFSTIAGIDSMTSTSALGSTQITLQFSLSRDIDAAAQDVQAAITQASRQLPADMPTPPTYRKVNPADQPILFLALTSPSLTLSALDEYGENLMAQQISMVPGVAQVQVHGSQKYAVRIQLDPYELASRGIGIDEVSRMIQASNVNLPTGILYGQHRAFTVEATGQLNEAADYRPMVVAYRNGSPVRLEELGKVFDGVENDKVAAWYSDREIGQQRSVVLAIQKQPGTNTVEVADAIKNLMPVFQNQLPASVSLHVIYDRSTSIQNSVQDVEFTMLLTLGLVIMVIFLFLRNLSATLIPSLVLPMSIVGTFTVMYVMGYSLDNLSLMALTLCIGFVVDDAIVMLENIIRHMEMGKSRFQAALDGAKEIGFTIISMTLSLAAVFIPVLFMGGIVGRLFREFSVTIGVAVLVSGVVSLTLTPMLASRFIREPGKMHHSRAFMLSENLYQLVLRAYGWTLRMALGHRLATIAVSLAILGGTIYLGIIIPKGFIPTEDRSQIMGQTEMIEGISYKPMREHQQAVNAVLLDNPNVESFMSSTSGGGARGGGGNTGFFNLRLKPRDQRTRGPDGKGYTADQIVQQLRAKLAEIPGIVSYPQTPLPIPIGGRSSKAQYQFTLQGSDTDELYRSASALETKLHDLPILQDVTSDLQIKNPQVNVTIDREKTATYAVTPAQIEDALYNAYGSRQISTILAPNNQYQVILELQNDYQLDPSMLSLLYIRSSLGKLVPLETTVGMTTGVGPMSINHSGQMPSVTISFNLRPGVSLGEAVDQVQALARANLPASVTTNFQGTAQAFQSSLKNLGLLLALAVLVIYLVLGILYESFIHPLTILTALPFAGFGALATLLLFNTELSLYAFVGLIMLVGLVKKNGIIMVDFAIASQKQGKSAPDAIHDACMVRFRPIMMTTMAALMAGLPIALGYGAGAEARRPLGLAVVGGLLFSQALTLYVTPVFYTYMDSLQKILGRWFHVRKPEEEVSPEIPETIGAAAK